MGVTEEKGARVNGKWWKGDKKAFRIRALGTSSSWRKREEQRKKDAMYKAKLKEMKDEKEEEHRQKVDRIRQRRQKKEEAERYERMAATMTRKKLDRKKRKEKRNKLLKER